MSAELLRRAASLMRSRAEAAICPCGGPVCNVKFGWFKRGELTARFDDAERAVPHVLHWSPAVALAVADWLDADATVIERHDLDVTVSKAYTVARAYLGEDA